MKNKISKLLTCVFSCVFSLPFISSTTVFAAGVNEVTPTTTKNQGKIIQNLSSSDYAKLKSQISKALKKSQTKSNVSSGNNQGIKPQKLTTLSGAAPQLTYLDVYGILSDEYGFEEKTSDSQLASVNQYDDITVQNM